MTNRSFPSSSRFPALRSKLPITLAVPFLALAAFGQVPATWKTVTNKETGVSVLMPPGVELKTTPSGNEKLGEKIITLQGQVQTTGDDGYFYMLEALRLNKAAVAEVQKGYPDAKEPMTVLVDIALKPFLGMVGQSTKEHPDTTTVNRKPIVASGLNGEDITVKENAGPRKGSFAKLRVLRDASGFFVVFAGERKATPQTLARVEKVLTSLTITPTDPFAASDTPAPAVPAQPAQTPATP